MATIAAILSAIIKVDHMPLSPKGPANKNDKGNVTHTCRNKKMNKEWTPNPIA